MQTLPVCDPEEHYGEAPGNVAGFSLHAGVTAKAHERDKLERLCRYITRPAVSEKRLSLTAQGKVRYALKTPYRDGTTHVASPAHPCTAFSSPWTNLSGTNLNSRRLAPKG